MKHLLHKLSSLRLLMLLAVLLGLGSGAAWADSYKLVKSASELSQNDIILITSGKDGAVKALGPQTGNNCPAKDITISSETITDKGDAQEIVFDKTDVNGYFTFNVGTDLYLYAASSGSNHLKTQASGAYWKILIDGSSYAATITDQSHQNNRNLLKYNSSSKLFSCYSSGQADVFIFKKVVITPAYTITAQSNNVDYGTVSISGSTITATPAAGYRYASSAYTVSPANSATVSQNGNEFSVTPSENTTVTINFEAIPTHTATFSINGNTDNTANFAEGADIIFPNAPADIDGKTFVGWVTSTIDGTTDEAPTFVTSATMGTSDVIYYAVFAYASGGGSSEVVDVLNYEWAGVTGTNYSSWSGNTATSSAVYAGNTAGGNDAIQLRSNNNNSGIVTTTSGGKATKVTVEWNSNTSAGRTLNVYGKNSAYSTASDLYNSSNQGTLLGTIVYDTSTELTIDGDYEYIGIRSASGAMYLEEVDITWSTGGGVSYSDYCTTVAAETVARPTIEVAANPFLFSTTATITCGTEGAAIKYSFDNENWNDYSEAFTITATTTLYAKAVKDENESSVASVEITKNLAEPTVTINAEGITNTNVFTSKEAGSLAAAVTYNDAAVEGATVTWSGDNDEVATIDDETGAVTLVAAGSVTFTATYAGNSDYSKKTATYEMTVTNTDPNAPGTENNPYTVAEAIDAIDAGTGLTGVYATGIVSEIVTPYNSQYGNITYNISADGQTTSDQLQAYRGKSYNGENFTSADDIQVGDIVVVYGNLTKYNSTYEFGQNNQLVSLSRKPATPTFSPAEGAVASGTEVTIESVTDGATIYYTVDGKEPTANSNVFDGAIAITEETTIKAIAVKDETSSDVATAHYTIAQPVATPTFSVAAGTYDTAQAVEITCATDGATIYYSFDNENWTEYTEALNIDEDKTVYAKAEKDGMAQSEVASVEYTFEIPSITFTEATPKNLTYEAQNYDFAFTTHYTSGNPEVVVCDYQGNATTYDWFSAEILNGFVRVSLEKNEDSENGRTAYFKVTAANAESEIYTVIQGNFVVDYAKLPFAFNDGKAAIEETTGLTQNGLGSDYSSAPKLKFDTTGDNLVLKINERPGTLTFDIKGNGFSGGTFTVQTSEDGQAYTDLQSYTTLGNTQSEEFDNLGENVRYIKWIYTSKSDGNVALGNIALAEYVEPVLTPTVTVSETAINATAEETDGTITVTYENITEINADIFFCDANGNSATYDWFAAEINNENNNVAYTIGANTGDERTGYLKVYALDDNTNVVYSELITITQAGYVAPAAGEKYNLFTGELVEGDYIIYYDGKAMNTTVESDRLQYEEVTPENDVITTNNAAIVWHIAKSGDYWTIYNAEADAYAASTGAKNKAQMLADGTDDKALWTVSGTETFEFVNKANDANNVNAYLRNNGTYGFACYAESTGGALSLYKKAGVKLNASGYATFASTKAVDFTHSETNGYSAWAVTAINGTEITFTQIQTAVAAGTGVLLKGTASTEIDPVYVEEGEAVEGNKLVGITEATEVTEGQYYGLKGDNFVKVNSGIIPAGKAILDANWIETSAGEVKALTFVFNDIATGVRTIETVSAEEAAKIFNLGGQRMSKMQRGINIINGKKVLVK